MRTLTPNEVVTLFDNAQGSYYYPVIYTALSTGLRQAELLGLRWRDVDLDMMCISVSQVLYKRRGVCVFKEPKTSHSRRRISMTPKLALFLKQYRTERERLYAELLKHLTPDDLVFTNIKGKPIEPCVLSHSFIKTAQHAGLGHVRFHDLRHTFAIRTLTGWYRGGGNPEQFLPLLSVYLGHVNVSNTYWYLSAVPELLGAVKSRLEHFLEELS